jgi:hypothetical protein
MRRLVYIGDDNQPVYDGGLTINKIYDECASLKYMSEPKFYCISKNDYGKRHWYQRSLFKTLDEIRDEKLLNILSIHD